MFGGGACSPTWSSSERRLYWPLPSWSGLDVAADSARLYRAARCGRIGADLGMRRSSTREGLDDVLRPSHDYWQRGGGSNVKVGDE